MRITKLESEGLYSYRSPLAVDVPDRVAIVGPNNSGKSNLFKMLEFFADALSGSSAPEGRKISKGAPDPRLKLHIKLSRSEAGKIVDFFSFYDRSGKRGLGFFEYKNRDRLEALLDEVSVEVFWKKTADSKITTRAQVEFVKTGIKMYEDYREWSISDEFAAEPKNQDRDQQPPIHELLAKLTGNTDAKTEVVQFFRDHGAITMSGLREVGGQVSGRGLDVLTSLSSYAKIEVNHIPKEIEITRIMWAILDRGIIHSPDSRHIDKPSILSMVGELTTPISGNPKLRREEDAYYNETLMLIAASKSPELRETLADDGSNLSSFLLRLKTAPSYTRRKRFKNIQKSFEKVFGFERLKFDVILKDAGTGKASKNPRAVQVPVTVVVNEESGEEFPLSDAGRGVGETIYLLALVLGSSGSVILLDEPSLNMHPGLMRSVLEEIHDTKENQIVIATHSPAIVRFMAFENSAGVFYVRKNRLSSTVRALGSEELARLAGKTRLRHIIDPGIFFARCVVLVEGESDKNLLIGVWSSLERESKRGMGHNDMSVVSVGGKGNFEAYRKILDPFGVPYMILADKDAEGLFDESEAVSGKTKKLGDCPVLVIKDGDLEALMRSIDPEAYDKAAQNCASKVAIAFEFAETVRGSERKTRLLRAIFRKAASLAGGCGGSR